LQEGTNNVAEYKGLISLMEGAISRGVRCLDAKGDSKLVVEQVKGTYQVREATLMKLHKEVKQLKQKFASFTITHIPRNENEEADRLTHVARETAVILANNTPPSPPMGSKEAAVAVVQAVVIGGAAVAGELITVLAKPHTMRRRTSYRVYREG